MKKYKIAFQLSGAPRTLESCVEGIRKYWEGRTDCEVFYFLTIWNDELSQEEQEKVISYFPNCSYLFLHTKDFTDIVHQHIHLRSDMPRPGNIWSQAYGRRLCNNLRKEYERKHHAHFDYVMIGRPDETYNTISPIDLQKHDRNFILVANHSHCSGINDHVFFSTPQIMDRFVKHYDWLMTELINVQRERLLVPYKGPFLRTNGYQARVRPYLTPEFLIHYWFLKAGLTWAERDWFAYKTVRSVHTAVKFEDIPQMSCDKRDLWRL